MDALALLQNRVSCAMLDAPAPTQEQIADMVKAAARAPDHAALKPWRLLLIEGEARHSFGEVIAQSLLVDNPNADAASIEKARRKPLRAPAIIVVIAKTSEHPKVPEIEQVITAGAAATQIVSAAFALGLGAYWRTGSPAYHPLVKEGLGLKANESIVGFIYLGTPQIKTKKAPEVDVDALLEVWA